MVEAVGPGVSTVKPGDKVIFSFVPTCGKCVACVSGRPALCGPGGRANQTGTLLRGARRFRRNGEAIGHHLGVSAFAQRTVAAEESLVRIPDDVPMEIAAIFGCAAVTGLGAVIHVAGVQPGTSVAVFGAGGVGLMAILGAALVGAGTIIVIDPLENKRTIARDLGATLAVDPSAGDAIKQIKDLTGGRGVDYAIDASGVSRAFGDAIGATAPGGTAVVVGIPRHDATVPVSPALLVVGDKSIKGSFMGGSVPQVDIPRYVALWQAGRLPVDRIVSGTIGLDGLNEAMDSLAGGEALRTIVRPNEVKG